jgi:hypothetical protein
MEKPFRLFRRRRRCDCAVVRAVNIGEKYFLMLARRRASEHESECRRGQKRKNIFSTISRLWMMRNELL